MSNDCYSQGGRDLHSSPRILVGRNESDGHFQSPTSSIPKSPAQREHRFTLQDPVLFYQDVSQHRSDHILQHKELEPNQILMRREEKMTAVNPHQTRTIMQCESSPVSSPSLDGHSLYCTEVLPSSSPPSQPVKVEGDGTSGRDLVAINRGTSSQNQPVQYTIIITDPHLQQNNNGGNSNSSHTTSATSILLNTLVQQQEQHQLQQHLAAASKASNNNNVKVALPTSNTNFILNANNINGSNKLTSLLINNNNLTSGSSSSSNITSSPSTFPTNFIVNGLNNSFDGKSIQLANVTFTTNNKLSPAVLDSGGVVILNYSDPQLRTAPASITNINQLVSLHGGNVVPTNLLIPRSSSNCINKEISDANTTISVVDTNRTINSTITNLCNSSVFSQVDVPVSTGSLLLQNRQVYADKQNSGIIVTNENNTACSSQPLVLTKQQLLDSATYSDSVSVVGMHSGRTGPGSGQAHNTHPLQQQQQRNSPTINSSVSSVSTAATNQSIMLSAGQSALPLGIFRTAADNVSHSPRFTGSGSYVHAQYPSIYGIHGQSGHLTTLQPYSTYFPGFGGSSASGHNLSHGSLMSGTAQVHYPQVESYSAMLASMGSHVQHRSTQGTDRQPRMSAPEATVSQHIGPFLPSTVHLAVPVSQYPSIQSNPHHHHLSDSRSSSPRSASTIHNPTGTHQDPLSSRHLEKMASMKGGSAQGREGRCPGRCFMGLHPAYMKTSQLSLPAHTLLVDMFQKFHLTLL